jgi:transglutaminase-like putative cysteine protease
MNTRRLPIAPAEGWVTLLLVLVMCVVLALAVDDARWVLGREEYLDMLVLTALGGVLAGFIGPKVGWGRWLTYLVGAIFAALIVPILTGLVTHPGGAPIHDLFDATAYSVVQAWIDLTVRNLAATPQFLHYVFTLGLVVWATSMFASYAVFGHHRPLNAVIIIGVVLLANMALTFNDQLAYLIVFSVASLLLLIRSHVFDEQSEWMRRRIGDPASISSVYLRGGTVFIAIAVFASAVLTATAASAPLAGAWDGVEDGLLSLSRSVSRYLPTGGSTRPVGLTFGSNTQVGQVWQTDPGVAVIISRNPTDKTAYYWRAVTFDRIDPRGWGVSQTATTDRAPGASIFAGMADDVGAKGRKTVTFTVTPVGYSQSTVFAPQTPTSVNQPTKLQTIGGTGRFMILDRDGGSGPYAVTASVPVDGNDDGQLNESALRAASTTYPDDIKALYLDPGTSMGPQAEKLEAKILSLAESDAPYDIARAAVKELQSSDFKYAVDVRDLKCETLSTVECFATFKKGFCQYYAATMAVILRDLGIPARIAEGFLPGTLDQGGNERIQNNNAHAWVEVFFPGYGWVTFDPTSPDVAQLAALPSGRPLPSIGPRPSFSAGPRSSPGIRDIDEGPSGPVQGGTTRTNLLGPFLAVGLLLIVVVAVVAFLAWRRGPRGPTSADGAYGTVTRIASRFGFAPRPAETVYEYATSLGQVLPDARPELQTVARAKVETTYAKHVMSDERLANLRAAQRRLRVSLLRLAFRRKERRRRR